MFKRKSVLCYVSMSSSEVVSSATVILFMIFLNLQSNFDDPREKFVVRARGLSLSATAESVAEVFSGKSYKIF